MSEIFRNTDYRAFMRGRIQAMPRKGRGQLSQLAFNSGISLSTVSQVFHGNRDFTAEQAIEVAHFLKLEPFETEYFLAMVEFARAGNQRLRVHAEARLLSLRRLSLSVLRPLFPKADAQEEMKHILFSDWFFETIRLLKFSPQPLEAEALSARLNVPAAVVRVAMEHLTKSGLCRTEAGRYSMSPGFLHLPEGDSLFNRLHQSWRTEVLTRIEGEGPVEESEFCATLPSGLNQESVSIVRKILQDAFQEARRRVGAAASQECLVLVSLSRLKG